MYRFKMKLPCNEEDLFCIKAELLNLMITLPLAKLVMVDSRLVSNGLIFLKMSYSSQYPVSNFFFVIQRY